MVKEETLRRLEKKEEDLQSGLSNRKFKMAYNVFGVPVTTTVLEGMPEFAGKEITRKDRAAVAYNLKNTQNKDKNVLEYVERLNEKTGVDITTLVVIYNATGDPLTLVNNHDWFGYIGPAPIPTRIENGQWGGFIHIKPSGKEDGSHGAVVYRGKNDAGTTCDWLAAWTNPWTVDSWDNAVYTEIRESGYYDKDHWAEIHDILDQYSFNSRPYNYLNLFRTATWNGCTSTVSTGNVVITVVEAIFSLVDV